VGLSGLSDDEGGELINSGPGRLARGSDATKERPGRQTGSVGATPYDATKERPGRQTGSVGATPSAALPSAAPPFSDLLSAGGQAPPTTPLERNAFDRVHGSLKDLFASMSPIATPKSFVCDGEEGAVAGTAAQNAEETSGEGEGTLTEAIRRPSLLSDELSSGRPAVRPSVLAPLPLPAPAAAAVAVPPSTAPLHQLDSFNFHGSIRDLIAAVGSPTESASEVDGKHKQQG
jgi:hypothetical protein